MDESKPKEGRELTKVKEQKNADSKITVADP
jgi:hypothetical protein